MESQNIRKVLVVGGGTMGQQIAFQCAAHGYEVTLYDVNEPALAVARERLAAYADELVAGGHIKRLAAEKALAKILATTDEIEAAGEVDLLSESVPEDPAL